MGWYTPFHLMGYLIWISRNKNNSNKTNFPPLLKTIIEHAPEFLLLNSTSAPLQSKMSVKISWHAPHKNWYKLNTDGAYKNCATNSGIGGVFRYHTGNWIIGFQKQDTAISPIHAELQAIYEGLQIATNFKLFPLEVETNSTAAINAIHQDHIAFSNIVYAYRPLKHQQKDLLLRHNFHEGNQVVYLLAKDATKKDFKPFSSDRPRLHATPPLFVKLQLTTEQNRNCLFEKSVATTSCNMLGTLGNQNISCDIPPMSGNFSSTCNKLKDF